MRSYFIDFDGTITTEDTCYAMVKAFAADGWRELDRLWASKKISTEECANRTFQLFQAIPEDLTNLLRGIKIDPYFKRFVALARARNEKIRVLSDGYDFNIREVFANNGIDLPYYANGMTYSADGGFQIECRYRSTTCGTCGTCKKMLMDELAEKGAKKVYIGDGYSDTCPAAHADLVFAKGDLLRYCQEHGIPAVPFGDFGDIIKQLAAPQVKKQFI